MKRPALGCFLLAVAVGILLRTVGLGAQIQGGDELHAPRATLQLGSVAKVLVTYRGADNCIPLTALFRAWIDAGFTLRESLMRIPSMLAGSIFLVVAPLYVGRRFGVWTGVVFAWLIAMSPGLVFYSRIVRSYMPAVLLASTAIWCFYRWWTGRGLRFGVAYVLCAALSAWFHLGSSPFVATPLLFAAVAAVVASLRGGERPAMGLLPVILLGLGLALAVAAFAVPARETLLLVAQNKHEQLTLRSSSISEMIGLQAGSRQLIAIVVFWAVVAFGLWRLWRRRPTIAVYLMSAILVQIFSILLLAPAGMEHPLILNRYLLFELPIVLLFAAIGIVAIAAWMGQRWSRLRWLPVLSFLALPLPGGPWLRDGFWSSSFMHHNDYFRFTDDTPLSTLETLPEFYQALARESDDRPVLEYPWHPAWNTIRSYPAYQRLHGKPVQVVLYNRDLRSDAIAWRHLFHFDPPALLASDARLFVLHRDLIREENVALNGELRPRERQMLERVMGAVEPARLRLGREWGAPVHSDETVLVWDLDAVRASH